MRSAIGRLVFIATAFAFAALAFFGLVAAARTFLSFLAAAFAFATLSFFGFLAAAGTFFSFFGAAGTFFSFFATAFAFAAFAFFSFVIAGQHVSVFQVGRFERIVRGDCSRGSNGRYESNANGSGDRFSDH
ncbi:MAG: hypothetical protein HKN57_12295 [Xanthomonadales bacterium]|nr:hypothetical protein [Gammaproteobacteria bacterium]MBT8053309.1 hypothetical protein [Gammaproteobacteria bacterium]NND58021.1 hypothetical protein [Xanthomonadales bacterium]NNK52118.1 hypothetical protein [Xanthomonadales bacterium]